MQVPETVTLPAIRLRRPRISDAEAIFEYASDQEVARYADWPVLTTIEPVIESLRKRPQQWESGEEYYWIITQPKEDRAIGGISCVVDGHAAHFGYLVNRHYWGQGIATAAARAIVNWLIAQPPIWRVWATCDTDNIGSVRVLAKAGLTREAILRRYAIRPNLSPEPRAAYIYARVRDSDQNQFDSDSKPRIHIMNNATLHQMFAFNQWANLELIEFCSHLSEEQLTVELLGVYDRIRPTIIHFLRAEGYYIKHLTGTLPWPAELDWDSLTFSELYKNAKLTGSRLLELAAQVDPEQTHETIRDDGSTYRFYNWTVLLQAYYHGVEHRTQIKILLTHLGVEHPELSVWQFTNHDPINQESGT